MVNGGLFDNMPSADTDKCRPVDTDKNKVREILGSEPAKSIIRKHNAVVGYADDIILAVFFKGNLNDDSYWKSKETAEKSFQDLIHELDLNTELYFPVCNSGNFGWRANKNTYEMSPSSYKYMMSETEYSFQDFYPLKRDIADFARTHGAENTMCIAYSWNSYDYKLKGYANSSDIRYEDIKEEILEYAKTYIGKKHRKFEITLSVGKRASDSKQYEAFVISYKGDKGAFSQKGSFVISQNKFGDGFMEVRVPLAGETKYKFDFNDWKSTVEDAIDWICS